MLLVIFNMSGLVFNMLGTAILFKWGLPQPSFQEGDLFLLSGKESQERRVKDREERERYTRISKLGLALLFIGFGLQLIAIWL